MQYSPPFFSRATAFIRSTLRQNERRSVPQAFVPELMQIVLILYSSLIWENATRSRFPAPSLRGRCG